MSYVLAPEAAEELQEIFEWYLAHASSRVAAIFLEEFERTARLVEREPGLGTMTGNGWAVFPVFRYPYSLIYRATDEGIRIGAIAHKRRGPGYRKTAEQR
ncbi:MAG: hypothetical protein AMXMBFR78_16540 [Rubrivivax sp.]|nr:type II toxin-antitoxin system RelE/ParE family toxin [Rubrivivax sp.]